MSGTDVGARKKYCASGGVSAQTNCGGNPQKVHATESLIAGNQVSPEVLVNLRVIVGVNPESHAMRVVSWKGVTELQVSGIAARLFIGE